MMCQPKWSRPLVAVLSLAFCSPLVAEPPAPEKKTEFKKPVPTQFLRIKRDGKDDPVALETATVRYVPASGNSGVTVDLIAVVHVADQAYYEKLNKQFEQYDALLYELVAPPGTRIPKGGKRDSGNPIAFLQKIMKNVLALDAQVEHIDYTKKNFIHADLSPDQMAEAMRKRGETGFTLFLSILSDVMKQQNQLDLGGAKKNGKEEEEVDILSLLIDPDGSTKLKRLMAQQFEAMNNPNGGLGNTLGTILISDRNQAAVKVLEKEIAKGKKKLAIFYGAAHMPDFEKRLRDELGFKRESEQWSAAWDLKVKKGGLNDLSDLFKK